MGADDYTQRGWSDRSTHTRDTRYVLVTTPCGWCQGQLAILVQGRWRLCGKCLGVGIYVRIEDRRRK